MDTKDSDKEQKHRCDSWNHECDGDKFQCCFDPARLDRIDECLCELKDQLGECEGILRFLALGLKEIKHEVNRIEGAVFSPTFGLSEIKSEITAIESAVFSNTFGLMEIKSEVSALLAMPELRVATLTGAAEVPPNNSSATGFALITLNEAQGQICWDISVSGLTTPATAAHIQKAPAGMTGPVVFTFTGIPNQTSWTASGCNTADQALINDIINHPENYYVNVHTTTFPGGEIRGQLRSP